MAITVRELVAILGFDVDDAGAKKAETLLGGLTKGALALVGAAAAGAAGLVALAVKASQAGDEAAKAAQKFGITAQEAQELKFIAESNSISFEQLGIGLKFMQRSAVDAAKGGKEASAAYAQLGIKVRDSNGQVKPTTVLFREVATRIAAIEDPAKRTALSMKIFGRSGSELLPILLEGGDKILAMQKRAQELGGVLDKDAVKAATELDDALDDMGFAIGGVSKRIGAVLFPAVTKVVKAITGWLVANRKLIDGGIKVLASAVGVVVDGLLAFGRFINENKVFVVSFIAVAMAPLIASWISLAAAATAAAAAQLAAIAVPALLTAAFVALVAIIALVIEDIYYFVTGGKSALGDLREALNRAASAPNASNLIKFFAFIVEGTAQAVEAVNAFFEGFFAEAEKVGGIGEALKNMFTTAVDFWKSALVEFFAWVGGKVRTLATELGGGVVGSLRGLFGGGGAANIPGLGGATTATPFSLPSTSRANSTSTTNNLGGASAQVAVSVSGSNASAADIGAAAKDGVSAALKQAQSNFSTQFRSAR